jgi:hypothetical protein
VLQPEHYPVTRPSNPGGGRVRFPTSVTRRLPAGVLPVCVLAALAGAAPVPLLSTAVPPAESQSASAPGPKPFQPGVTIDWQAPAVYVDTHVVLRRGPLEFYACGSGKEHESILRLHASAAHVYLALGLIGVSPGHPPVWDDSLGEYAPPAGDLVEISCEWKEGGKQCRADAWTWLREIEYARPPLSRPWVFGGSVRLENGALAADRSGAGVALVDFSDALLSLSRGHSSRNAELWVEANTDAIPPLDTPVRLVLRPARRHAYRITLDFRGQTFVDGRWAALKDVADLLRMAGQVDPQRTQDINTAGTLRSDVAQVRHRLAQLGVPTETFRFVPATDATTAPVSGPAHRR